MLAKKKFLISALLSTIILTNSGVAQGTECSGGNCQVNVKKFTPSKNMPKQTKSFKKFKQKHRFLFTTHQDKDLIDEDLKIDYQRKQLDTFRLESNRYLKQDNEVLEPLTDEELNTIILAPNKYVGTEEEIELYLRQQREIGIDLEEIQLTLPMSLYYCKNDTEPIYDDKLEQFQCIISSQNS
jgi:hypothetical protein